MNWVRMGALFLFLMFDAVQWYRDADIPQPGASLMNWQRNCGVQRCMAFHAWNLLGYAQMGRDLPGSPSQALRKGVPL